MPAITITTTRVRNSVAADGSVAAGWLGLIAVLRKEKPLAREIVLLLVVKLCALTAIWYAFYRAPVIPSMIDGMDPSQVSQAVLRKPVYTKVSGSEESE